MNPSRFGLAGIACLLIWAQSWTKAATIVAETGQDAYGWTANDSRFGIVSWTQVGAYEDVSIAVHLQTLEANDGGTAYLTTRIGPGTTLVNEVASAPFTFPQTLNPSEVTLFTGLSLGPGTYYLTVAGGANDWSTWIGSAQQNVVTDVGVTFNGDFHVFDNPAPYAPASPYFSDHPSMHHIFRVDGVAVAVPEPRSWVLAIMGVCVLGAIRGSRLGRKPGPR